MENKGVKVVAQQSLEDYLETILIVSQKKEFVRPIDLANELNYSRPSVTIALQKLKREDFILIDEKSHITLTEKGLQCAKRVFFRHEILTKYLMKIGVPFNIAEQDACTIEHVISEETFEAIKRTVNNEEN